MLRNLMLLVFALLILAAYSAASEDEFQLQSRVGGLHTWSALQWEQGR